MLPMMSALLCCQEIEDSLKNQKHGSSGADGSRRMKRHPRAHMAIGANVRDESMGVFVKPLLPAMPIGRKSSAAELPKAELFIPFLPLKN